MDSIHFILPPMMAVIYIDNVPVVNNDGLHGAIEKSGTIGLQSR